MSRLNLWAFLGIFLGMVGVHREACGQAVGVEVVVDTAFTAGELEGYVSYLVYAQFENPGDFLSAVFADSTSTESGPLSLQAPCGCYNPITTSVVMDATNNSNFWAFEPFALNEYDTFWTIGLLSGNVQGQEQLPLWSSFDIADPNDMCDIEVDDGAAYVLGTPPNAMAGDDLKVVVARVTTCGDWTLNLNLQVFVNGDQENDQLFLLDANGGPIQIEDPCEDYDEVEANVSGLVTQCAGLPTNVELEFLGLSQADENTSYTLVTSTDNFATDTAIVSQTGSNQFPGLEVGDYQVWVSNEYGCKDTTSFSVTSPLPIEASITLAEDNECYGEGNGEALIVLPDSTLTGGTGNLLVTATGPLGNVVNPSNDEFGRVWEGLACQDGSGVFAFSVSDANGCTLHDTVVVNCPEPIEVTFSYGNVVCQGDADGFIVAEASGGSGELYLQSQFETVPLEEGLLDLGPAIYNVYVVDDFDCRHADTASLFLITEPSALEFVTPIPVTNPSCGLDCDGEVAVEAFGGMGALEVSYYNESINQLFADSASLCPGDYIITVTDTSGCELDTLVVVEAPDPLDFLIFTTDVTCTGMSNGSADVYPFGGEVSDEEWNLVVVDTAGNSVIDDLNNLAAMTYTAFVTDQIGCSHSETFDIEVTNETDMELILLASPVTCWNAADGTVTVSVNGGLGPFTYEWNDPFAQSTSTAVGLTEDVYSVVVTDAVGCRRSATQRVEAIEGCLYIADALTPNGDGKNDEWIVGGLEDYPDAEVLVFNRWGQKVFSATGGEKLWDGRWDGVLLPIADYYYTIELFPRALPIRGTVTLKY